MKKQLFLSLLCLIIFSSPVLAQAYLATAGETIFSYGDVDAGSTDIKPVVRFSPVFNFQEQIHFNFSRNVGIYTGLGFRNVGLISKINYDIIDTAGTHFGKEVTIKERSYSLGLPLALKFGDLDEGVNFAIGGEAEVMFAYKRKIIDGDTKNKSDSWFDDNVTIFNPSVFAEVKFKKGQYIRFKYYILDFLDYQGVTLIDQTFLPEYGKSSPLFYVSLGAVSLHKDMKKGSTAAPETTSAYFKSDRKNHHDPVASGQ